MKWNWHIWLLLASYRRIQSTNRNFFLCLFCLLYLIYSCTVKISAGFVWYFIWILWEIFIGRSVCYLSECLEQKVLGVWIRSGQSNLSLIKTLRCSFHPNLKRAWLSDCWKSGSWINLSAFSLEFFCGKNNKFLSLPLFFKRQEIKLWLLLFI